MDCEVFYDFKRVLIFLAHPNFSWRVDIIYPPNKNLKTSLGPLGIFTANKDHIGSAISEILRYRQEKLNTLYNTSGYAP